MIATGPVWDGRVSIFFRADQGASGLPLLSHPPEKVNQVSGALWLVEYAAGGNETALLVGAKKLVGDFLAEQVELGRVADAPALAGRVPVAGRHGRSHCDGSVPVAP